MRGGWVVKQGQKPVYVVIEWPLNAMALPPQCNVSKEALVE